MAEIEITRWLFEAQIGFIRQGSILKHLVVLSNLKWQARLIYRYISFFVKVKVYYINMIRNHS